MNTKKQYNDPCMELYRLEQTEQLAEMTSNINDGHVGIDEDE